MEPIAEIRLVLEAKAAALVGRDADALAALIHDRFVYVNAAGRIFDKADYIETYCTSGRIVFEEQLFSDIDIKQIDDFAIATLSVNDELRIGAQTASGQVALRLQSPAGPLVMGGRSDGEDRNRVELQIVAAVEQRRYRETANRAPSAIKTTPIQVSILAFALR